MFKYFFLIFFFLIGLSKTWVFYLERQYVSLVKEIKTQVKDCKLLNIEWTYLNQNGRLQELANKHLPNWQPVELKQLKSLKKNEENKS